MDDSMNTWVNQTGNVDSDQANSDEVNRGEVNSGEVNSDEVNKRGNGGNDCVHDDGDWVNDYMSSDAGDGGAEKARTSMNGVGHVACARTRETASTLKEIQIDAQSRYAPWVGGHWGEH
ncbi:hypothetical protein K474DRAFT_1676749 [Panus rudis PR-1116 ss-1]|nr:hypothetical protein K474DRAFT_1676749 [Panus rudis PR-1116 ss-1]